MRRAASYFECVHGSQLDRFTFKHIPGSAFTTDLDARIVQCMAEQCLAEAQEVTLNRARLKGHTAAIIAGIALDERDRFRAAKKRILQMVGAENQFRNWFRPPHRSRPILPLVTRDPSMRRCHSRDHTGAGNGGLGGWRVRGPGFRSCCAAVVGWARSHGWGPSTFRFPNASARLRGRPLLGQHGVLTQAVG